MSLAVADAYYRSADWARLKQALASSPPDRLDFFRLALQSRMLKEQGDESGARDAWRRALDAAKTAQEWLEKLARVTLARGWQQESEETLWALAETPSCPRWALDALWGAVRKVNNTAKICRVAKRLFQAAPNELSVRGNFVYLALLTRNAQENPDALAEALYKENPGKAAIVRIYGLSLYLQGRKDEAVQVMGALPVKELQQPAMALYYGIFLAANGQFDKSREYLQRARTWPCCRRKKRFWQTRRKRCVRARNTLRQTPPPEGYRRSGGNLQRSRVSNTECGEGNDEDRRKRMRSGLHCTLVSSICSIEFISGFAILRANGKS